jgi:hypothetical protein
LQDESNRLRKFKKAAFKQEEVIEKLEMMLKEAVAAKRVESASLRQEVSKVCCLHSNDTNLLVNL